MKTWHRPELGGEEIGVGISASPLIVGSATESRVIEFREPISNDIVVITLRGRVSRE